MQKDITIKYDKAVVNQPKIKRYDLRQKTKKKGGYGSPPVYNSLDSSYFKIDEWHLEKKVIQQSKTKSQLNLLNFLIFLPPLQSAMSPPSLEHVRRWPITNWRQRNDSQQRRKATKSIFLGLSIMVVLRVWVWVTDSAASWVTMAEIWVDVGSMVHRSICGRSLVWGKAEVDNLSHRWLWFVGSGGLWWQW